MMMDRQKRESNYRYVVLGALLGVGVAVFSVLLQKSAQASIDPAAAPMSVEQMLAPGQSPGAASPASGSEQLETLVKRSLGELYPRARIDLVGAVRWASPAGGPAGTAASARVLGEPRPGEATFEVISSHSATGERMISQGSVAFAAWALAPVATRRVYPGQRLRAEYFSQQEVNLARGYAHEIRGAIVFGDAAELATLEAKQTILEGQFPLATSVQKVPDLKRGEQVLVKLTTGELSVTMPGIADEPGYLDSRVRVLTQRTKKFVIGRLTSEGVVEVRL